MQGCNCGFSWDMSEHVPTMENQMENGMQGGVTGSRPSNLEPWWIQGRATAP